MGKIVFYGFFCILKFHGKIILKCNFFSSFVGIVEMLQSFLNQNNTLLDYYIIYMCIYYNIMLNWDINHHLLQNFIEN